MIASTSPRPLEVLLPLELAPPPQLVLLLPLVPLLVQVLLVPPPLPLPARP